jgi:hypothetical protein
MVIFHSLPEGYPGYPQLHSQAQALHIGRDFAGVRFHMRQSSARGIGDGRQGLMAPWLYLCRYKPWVLITMVFPMVEVETMGFTMGFTMIDG